MVSLKYSQKCLTFLILLSISKLRKNHIKAFEDKSLNFVMLKGDPNNLDPNNVIIYEDLQFPGNNQRIRQKVTDMWEKYYKCLKDNAAKETKLKIQRFIEGQFTQLKCDICVRPFDDFQDLEWKYRSLAPGINSTNLEHLDITPEMELTNNKTLQIFNMIEDNAGLYVCYQNKNLISAYVLEIVKNGTLEKVETSDASNTHTLNIGGGNLQVYYRWSPWTECSFCGNVGRKFKYGTCFLQKTVSPSFVLDKSLTENEFFFDWEYPKVLQSKRDAEENVTSEKFENLTLIMQLLEKFESGMPCSSPYVKDEKFKDNEYNTFKAIVKYCSVNCPEDEIFEVLDRFGNVVEVANNSAGIYSSFQKIPPLPPDINRKIITADFGTDIIIQCPSTLHKTIPVTWKLNGKIIFPEIVANLSKGRFSVDLINRIYLKRLRMKDSNLYSCWQRNKLVGTVRLIVEKKFKIGFDRHFRLVGMILIILTFLLVGSQIMTRELRQKRK